ncbi:Sugar-transfer associated ATP-grasp [Arsukibacterium tuosuense]|uniref:Sugar-transfer associated ATP-grasp n=1 Tax=Arsukibacterium tuosuense TaxID=1323745 RepID=A0A285IUC1_9GAMM|nr:sugar-transfer associated ATP-grasp domain-containing protein [Arsukibacterium tuosuense]SNY51630.1 Sugar-transfer associated ATP-grasp [Arsukibacterium tuosuense]
MLNNLVKALRLSWLNQHEENTLSFLQQFKEMLLLKLITGFGPGNYHKYRLWQKDMPWQQKLGYWHDQKYYRFLNRVNPLNYRMLARNKVIAKAILNFYKIPDAEYLGYLSAKGSFSTDGLPLNTAEELSNLLQQRPDLNKICFKLVDGSGGVGFCAVKIVRDNTTFYFQELGKDINLPIADYINQLLINNKGCDYLIENYLEQHADLAVFNPSSLNTLRVWVGKTKAGTPKIIGIFLRVGRAGSLVDNTMWGGLVIAIDPQSFTTTHIVPLETSGSCFRNHPDSGYDITRRQLPFQQHVIDLAEKVTDILPKTRFVGLDIAFTPEQPVIIEVNLAPSAIGASAMNMSHQQLLGWLEE